MTQICPLKFYNSIVEDRFQTRLMLTENYVFKFFNRSCGIDSLFAIEFSCYSVDSFIVPHERAIVPFLSFITFAIVPGLEQLKYFLFTNTCEVFTENDRDWLQSL